MRFCDRNLRREQEIEECLLEQMREFPYQDITVKMLTDKLNMARKTFYHYFPSKQACLESLTDRLLYECGLQQMQPSGEDSLPDQTYTQLLRFWIAHKAFLEAVNRNGLGSFFLDRLLIYLSREDKAIQNNLSTEEVACDEDILFFYVSGYLFLLLKWCHDGFSLSVEEMVQKLMRLLHEPLVQLEEE